MKISDNRLKQLLLSSIVMALFAPQAVIAGNFSITMENDFFGSAGTDRYFTNGLNLTYVTDQKGEWQDSLADFSNRQKSPFLRRVSYIGGQDIYTPQDIEKINLIENDRPYSGWLYLGMGVHDRSELLKHGQALRDSTGESQNSTEVIFGVVGPQSYAGDVQYWWHENVIGFSNTRKPSGWDNQLDNELAFALIRERKWRNAFGQREKLGFDLIRHLGVAVGTVTTYASVGAEARLGWSLSDDFGSAKNRPGLTATRIAAPLWGANPESGQSTNPFSFHLFAKVDGRAVLRDIFLDGNTFADSHSVDRKPLTTTISSGVSLLLWQKVELCYTHVYQSKEFEAQPLAHVYGSLTVSAYW